MQDGYRKHFAAEAPFGRLLRMYWPALAAGAAFLLFGLIKDGPIGLATGRHWANWWDQQLYFRSAIALAHGDLSSDNHWYPLLYPLLAAPSIPLFPRNPFLLLDIACVAITAQAVTRVGTHLGIRRGIAFVLFVATSFLHPGLLNSWADPWTSTLSAALIWWLLARLGDAVLVAPPSAKQAAAIGLVAVLIPLARPADAIVPVILGLCMAAALLRQGALTFRIVAATAGAAAVALLAYAALHLAIYGAATSDYMRLSSEIGLSFAHPVWKAWVLLVDPGAWFAGEVGLLGMARWLPLGIAGAGYAIWSRRGSERFYLACLFVTAAAHILMLTTYVDLLPTGLARFNVVHYFKWTFPLFALAAWLWLREVRARPKPTLASLAVVVAITGLRFNAVPAAPDAPARRIDFAAPATTEWMRVNVAPSVIADSHGTSRNVIDYRQSVSAERVRAIALRSDFQGEALWHSSGMPGIMWPKAATGDALPAAPPTRPIARWKPQLGWGVPCWIRTCHADR